MKKIAAWSFLLIGLSSSSLAAARLSEQATIAELLLDGPFWLGMMAVIGSIFLNHHGRSANVSPDKIEKDAISQVSGWITEILLQLKTIEQNGSLTERVLELTKLQDNLIFSVTNTKDHLIAAKGFAFYARFMSDFAVAERFLARSWSAAVDNYPDESDTYLKKAESFFIQSKHIIDGNSED